MPLRAENKGSAVDEAGGAFGEGGVDNLAEVEWLFPFAVDFVGDVDVCVAEGAVAEGDAVGAVIADTAGAVGDEDNRRAVGGHYGVGIEVNTVYRTRELDYRVCATHYEGVVAHGVFAVGEKECEFAVGGDGVDGVVELGR